MAILSLLMLASCRDNDRPDPSAVAAKTIFIYMPWTASETSTNGSLYSYFLNNISDIENGIVAQNGLGNNRVLVFVSSSPTQSTLFEIRYERGQCVRDTLRQYGYIDYTTPSGIASILSEVKASAPAQQYGMIIGSHANGWIPKGVENYSKTRALEDPPGATRLTCST